MPPLAGGVQEGAAGGANFLDQVGNTFFEDTHISDTRVLRQMVGMQPGGRAPMQRGDAGWRV